MEAASKSLPAQVVTEYRSRSDNVDTVTTSHHHRHHRPQHITDTTDHNISATMDPVITETIGKTDTSNQHPNQRTADGEGCQAPLRSHQKRETDVPGGTG
jgi:hypothetical protein